MLFRQHAHCRDLSIGPRNSACAATTVQLRLDQMEKNCASKATFLRSNRIQMPIGKALCQVTFSSTKRCVVSA